MWQISCVDVQVINNQGVSDAIGAARAKFYD